MVRLWVGEIVSWGDCELGRLWVDEFVGWWVCKLVSLQVGELVGWWVGWLMSWLVCWWTCKFMNCWVYEFFSLWFVWTWTLPTRSLVYSFTCLLVNLLTYQPVNSLTSQFVNSFPCLLVTPSLLTYPFTILLAIIVIVPIGVAVNTAKGVNAFGTILVFVL